jgi:hypothetical protein
MRPSTDQDPSGAQRQDYNIVHYANYASVKLDHVGEAIHPARSPMHVGCQLTWAAGLDNSIKAELIADPDVIVYRCLVECAAACCKDVSSEMTNQWGC